MTDPIRHAKPVGPAGPAGQPLPPPNAPPDSGPGSPQGPPPGQPFVRTYIWPSSRRSIPWLAVLLVVLGVALLLELLVPGLSLGSLIILAIGIAFGAAWLLLHVVGATMPALIFVAWGISDIATDLDYPSGDGWTPLFVGVAMLIGWAMARYQHARRGWALVVGIVFSVIGLADVSDTVAVDLDMFVIIPLAMIGIGLFLILRDRLPAR